MVNAVSEAKLHEQICAYIRMQYPKAIFNTDMSGIKLTMGQAVKAKKLRSSRGFPDLMIFEPRGHYSAMFLELKREGEKLTKKNGEWKSAHIEEQSRMMSLLVGRGFYANFAIGFNDAQMQIDQYMRLNDLPEIKPESPTGSAG